MRLLSTTGLRFKDFDRIGPPHYAILLHRWSIRTVGEPMYFASLDDLKDAELSGHGLASAIGDERMPGSAVFLKRWQLRTEPRKSFMSSFIHFRHGD